VRVAASAFCFSAFERPPIPLPYGIRSRSCTGVRLNAQIERTTIQSIETILR